MSVPEDRPDRVKALFQEALDLPDAERAEFLAAACAGDERLRAEVQDLLGALAQASGFLAEPSAPADERPGQIIDRYRLVDRIGEGGFGIVFRAEQLAPVRRLVALKILKRGMDSERIVRRFEQERQALARMQHPNIAAVFDGGTTPSGRPYFVMELVIGQPITAFCRDHGLGIEERLALMCRICLAVQHAHNKGVVHRDLKPANILVAADDDHHSLPKVIDFGVAKAIEPVEHGHEPTATGHGQPVGTLEYMAPEQTSGGGDIDSRADVYSLGVVLYELLTGRRPFERTDEPSGHMADLLKRIREQSALRPSVCARRASELPLANADRRRWSRRIHDDLDWIVCRALEKDPARRYPTPNALGEDLQRFLAGWPVEAGPPTTSYRLRRLIGRHRLAFGAAALLLVSLVAGFVSTTSALADAQLESEQKRRTLAAIRQLLLAADPTPSRGPDYKVRQLLDDFTAKLDPSFDRDPVVGGDLHLTIGTAYRGLGELANAERHVQRALALVRSLRPADPARLGQVLIAYAHVLRDAGRHGESEAIVDEALQLDVGASNDEFGVDCLLAKAELRRLHGDHGVSEQLARRVLERLDGGRAPRDTRASRALALDLLGCAAEIRGDWDNAVRLHESGLALRRERYGDDHLLLAISHLNIACAQLRGGDHERSVAAAQEALRLQLAAHGETHPDVARTLSLLGDLALRRDDIDAAETLYQRAHAIRLERLPDGHADRATGHIDLARIALVRGRDQVAERELRRAIEIQTAAGQVATDARAAALQNLGVALARQGRDAEAEQCYRDAYELHLQLGGETRPAVADCLQNMALLRLAVGDAAAAVDLHEAALRLRRRHRPDRLADLLSSLSGLAAAAAASGDLGRAARADADYADLMERRPGEHPQRVAAARIRAARRWLDAGDPVAAAPLIEAVHSFCERELPGRWPLGEAKSLLAECRLAAGDLELAGQLASEGLQLLATCPHEDRRERAEHTLARVRQACSSSRSDR